MASLEESLTRLAKVDGFLGACVVDGDSGMMLHAEGGNSVINLEVASAGNTAVVRSKRKTMSALGLDDEIEDILVTLGRQYHLIRPISQKEGFFIYLALDKEHGNLAMSRFVLSDIEKSLAF